MSDAIPLTTTIVSTSAANVDIFDWGTTAWSINKRIGNSEALTFGKVVIEPGKSNLSHRHSNCEEILYLLSGELVHYADDLGAVGGLRMGPGEAIVIPPGVPHHATCVSAEEAEMIVVYSSPAREIEVVED